MMDYDVCVIGSGAGGAPVAYEAALAGRRVVVLEKGPWLKTPDFHKDEIAHCRRRAFVPDLHKEPHVVEMQDEGVWSAYPTYDTGWDFWNGSMVGGATNLMAGYFHRLKPMDFRLRSEFGPVEGADVQDWPISYDDLEPYYAKVERVVGVSGRVVKHRFSAPRSTPDFPQPPIAEHPIAGWIDEEARKLGWSPLPVARAVLSRPVDARRPCEQSGYCGSYGCTSGAKGSARVALIEVAVATGRCEVRTGATVVKLHSAADGRVVEAEYVDAAGARHRVRAKTFVVACQPIETCRLLLASTGPKHPDGLANQSGLLGRYLVWSSGGVGRAEIPLATLSAARAAEVGSSLPFVNRALQDWYTIESRGRRRKGGTIDFLLRHPNPIRKAMSEAWDYEGPVWGERYKTALLRAFKAEKRVRFEVFCDWMPTADSRVTLDSKVVDRWGLPVARVRIGEHPENALVSAEVGVYGKTLLKRLGGTGVRLGDGSMPSTNLTGGGCRFGHDPATSVLNADCRAHDVENLYVTDGSFMPTGGSVPFTWTIYANAFRVADKLLGRGRPG